MLLSVALYTTFTVVMLHKSWSKSVYLYIIMGFIALYVVIFGIIIFLIGASGRKIDTSMKDYKSGLAILKSILTLLSITLSLSVFSLSIFSDIKVNGFKITIIIISLFWAVFQIIYQANRVIKRHRAKKKYNRH